MNEKTLLKIALAIGILGMALLFLMSNRIKIDEAMIGRMDEVVDESVVVTGSVIGVNRLDSVTSILIQKDEIFSVALFGKTPLIEVGDMVQVRGKVSDNNGETEIIGEEVRVV